MRKNEIWDDFTEVYHYTNFSTALLIIQTATLRATRIDLLNDTQEIIYARKIIQEKLLEKFNPATIENAKNEFENFFEAMGGNFYITSFCGINDETDPYHHENGLLSMWRSYGNDGGCAIIFKTKNIYDQAIKYKDSIEIPSALVMDKAIYKGENDDDQDYCERLNRIIEYLTNPAEIDYDSRDSLCIDILVLMVRSKHPAFFEEREVRIGLCFNKGIPEDAKKQTQKNFHEIPFSSGQDISRIIIGPHRDQKKRFGFLKSYFDLYDLNIDVAMSEIPLT